MYRRIVRELQAILTLFLLATSAIHEARGQAPSAEAPAEPSTPSTSGEEPAGNETSPANATEPAPGNQTASGNATGPAPAENATSNETALAPVNETAAAPPANETPPGRVCPNHPP